MSKLKKEIKRLKKQIRRDNEILIRMKERREHCFNQLCKMRGKAYYRENPLHPKVIETAEQVKPVISTTALSSALESFKEKIFNNVGKAEDTIRAFDAKIRKGEAMINQSRDALADLKELRKS